MMDIGDMTDRCMNAMGAMMGNSTMLVVLLAPFLLRIIGLGAVGALIFCGVSRLSRPHAKRPARRARGEVSALLRTVNSGQWIS